MLSEGSEKLTQHLIYSWLKDEPGGDTVAWQAVLADFDAMAQGIVDGHPIAQDGRKTWKFVLMVAKADEEARCNVFGLPHFGAEECCSECLCNKQLAGRPFTDLSAQAAWRPTEAMPFEFWQERIRQPPHP